jgi:acylphosphatase
MGAVGHPGSLSPGAGPGRADAPVHVAVDRPHRRERACEHRRMGRHDATAAVEVVRRRAVVEGRVQNVGYRASCARRARASALAGSVRNLADGRVEAIFEGPPDRVDELVEWCRLGPPSARVRSVQVTEELPKGASGFVVG